MGNDNWLIGRGIPWKAIEQEPLRITHFTPLVNIENHKVKSHSLGPYAFLAVESPKLNSEALLPVGHRVDFQHLWEVFKQRGVAEDEEVLVFYAPIKRKWYKWASSFLPKLHIFIFPKGHLEEIHNPNFKPDNARSWFKPIAEWRPDKMIK